MTPTTRVLRRPTRTQGTSQDADSNPGLAPAPGGDGDQAATNLTGDGGNAGASEDDNEPSLHGGGPPPPQPSSDDSDRDEPDDEPSPDHDGVSPDEASKPVIKIDTRNIKIDKFDGHVEQGQFDSNVRDWWEEFADQIEDAQVLAGVKWPERAKLAILKMHLTGMARRWFSRWRSRHVGAKLQDAGDALIDQFRSQLTDPKIAQKVGKEGKRWGETYREYADRLLVMTDSMEGGNSIASNARHALDAFVNLAWSKYTDHLKTRINLRSQRPIQELDRAVIELMDFAETDGKMHKARAKPQGASTPTPRGDKPIPRPNAKAKVPAQKNDKKRKAQASAAVVERKTKKPKAQPGRGKFACFICADPGHTAKYHREHLMGNNDDEETGQVNHAAHDSAVSAASDNSAESSDE